MKRVLAVAVLLVAAVAIMVPGASLYFEVGGGKRCAGCHEMQPLYDTWHASSHRSVGCGNCHGSALTAEVAFHTNNAGRAWSHLRGDLPEQIGFANRDVLAMSDGAAVATGRSSRPGNPDRTAPATPASFSRRSTTPKTC
jgi:hypothetical protein